MFRHVGGPQGFCFNAELMRKFWDLSLGFKLSGLRLFILFVGFKTVNCWPHSLGIRL